MYNRARKLTLEEVLPHIDQDYRSTASLDLWCEEIQKEIRVGLSSSRMRLIGRTQHCAACMIKGDHFWAESNSKDQNGIPHGWHLNFYAFNYHGDPVMMTLDHIRPKSKGGTKSPENIQLLCTRCNGAKGTKNISPVEIAARRAAKDPILEQALKDAGVI